MDITLIGRNVGITESFRSYVEEKSDRVEALAEKSLALEIRLCRHHETNGQSGDDRVEMTLIGPGPVIRAEADGADKFAAFDTALGKLMERVRRAKDRRKLHRGHGNRMESLREASSGDFAAHGLVPADGTRIGAAEATDAAVDALAEEVADATPSPVVIRSKRFPAESLSVEEAVDRMELVGHDFFLFIDIASGEPSVVYRRTGWNYGVIALDRDPAAADALREPVAATA